MIINLEDNDTDNNIFYNISQNIKVNFLNYFFKYFVITCDQYYINKSLKNTHNTAFAQVLKEQIKKPTRIFFYRHR